MGGFVGGARVSEVSKSPNLKYFFFLGGGGGWGRGER